MLKFLNAPLDEKKHLETEKQMWKALWGVPCRIVQFKERVALLMPFCLHVRLSLEEKPLFCHLGSWNKRIAISANAKDPEVDDILDATALSKYQASPLEAARTALQTMRDKGYRHEDFKWNHVALLPVYSVKKLFNSP